MRFAARYVNVTVAGSRTEGGSRALLCALPSLVGRVCPMAPILRRAPLAGLVRCTTGLVLMLVAGVRCCGWVICLGVRCRRASDGNKRRPREGNSCSSHWILLGLVYSE